MLEIKNLSKKFGNNLILKNINFKVNKGDIITIVGPSGSGKSTLLRCINMLDEASSGNIIFEGAVLGYNVKLGNGNIIWNGCNISHESVIGDFNHFSAGTTLGGKTVVENNCFFGMNSVIRGPKTVADYTLVGAGCYISDNTEPYGVYVPARSVHLENKKSTDMM